MPFLDRDGVKIYYEQRGSGPAVLLSHGYSASARMWEGQMNALSDRYISSRGICAVTIAPTLPMTRSVILTMRRLTTWPRSSMRAG